MLNPYNASPAYNWTTRRIQDQATVFPLCPPDCTKKANGGRITETGPQIHSQFDRSGLMSAPPHLTVSSTRLADLLHPWNTSTSISGRTGPAYRTLADRIRAL